MTASGFVQIVFHAGEDVDGMSGVAADPAIVDFLDGQRVCDCTFNDARRERK
jgi:hypothetical protein